MVRRRLPMNFIQDDRRRKATFAKRMPVIKKKAMELSKLCDIPVLLICNGNDHPSGGANHIETWPENQSDVHRIIQQYSMVSPEDRDRRKLNQKTQIQTQLKKMHAEIDRLRQSNIDAQFHMFRNGLLLDAKLEAVNARINSFLNSPESATKAVEIDNQAIVGVDDNYELSSLLDDQDGGCNGLDDIMGNNNYTYNNNHRAIIPFDHNGMNQDYQNRQPSNQEIMAPLDHQINTPLPLMVDYGNINLGHNYSMFGNSSFGYEGQNGLYSNHGQSDQKIMVGNIAPPPPVVVYDHHKNRSNWIGGNTAAVVGGDYIQLPWQYLPGSSSDQTSSVHGKPAKLGFLPKIW